MCICAQPKKSVAFVREQDAGDGGGPLLQPWIAVRALRRNRRQVSSRVITQLDYAKRRLKTALPPRGDRRQQSINMQKGALSPFTRGRCAVSATLSMRRKVPLW